MKLYLRDSDDIYSGEFTVEDPAAPLPMRAVPVAPPALVGSEVARWIGSGWEVLPERPAPVATQPVVPREVTRRQAKQALALSGLLGSVQPTIDSIADPAERAMVQIWWDDAIDFQRDHPMIVQMGTAMGLTSADLDQLFVMAKTL